MYAQNYGFPDNSFNAQPNNYDFQNNFFANQQQQQQAMTQQNQFMIGQGNNILPQNNNMLNTFNMPFQNMHIGTNNVPLQNDNNPTLQQNETENQAQAPQIYTTYANLPNYGDNIDLNQVVGCMKGFFEDKTHWKSKFDAVDNLRVLNKYHSKKMNEIIDMFWPYIIESFENQKTCIVKNILMFSAEAFMNAGEVRLQDEIISNLVPQVLNKSISEKAVIKKEAEEALRHLTTNCYFYDSTVVTLAKCCCLEKNSTVCEIALYTLGQVVYQIGDSLPMLKFETLKAFIYSLGKIMDSAKKGNMKKWANALCSNMYKRFGRENYQELVIKTIGEQYPELLQYLAKAVDEKKDGKVRDSGFHDYLKKQKDYARMSQVNLEMMNNLKMNAQPSLGALLDKQIPGLNYQYGNNQIPMHHGFTNGNTGTGLFEPQFSLNFHNSF